LLALFDEATGIVMPIMYHQSVVFSVEPSRADQRINESIWIASPSSANCNNTIREAGQITVWRIVQRPCPKTCDMSGGKHVWYIKFSRKHDRLFVRP
jgi:hypothetical protein